MHRLLATIVMVLMVPVPAIAQRLNPQYIISILNQNIDNYKVLRNRGDITAQEYFDRSWKQEELKNRAMAELKTKDSTLTWIQILLLVAPAAL